MGQGFRVGQRKSFTCTVKPAASFGFLFMVQGPLKSSFVKSSSSSSRLGFTCPHETDVRVRNLQACQCIDVGNNIAHIATATLIVQAFAVALDVCCDLTVGCGRIGLRFSMPEAQLLRM